MDIDAYGPQNREWLQRALDAGREQQAVFLGGKPAKNIQADSRQPGAPKSESKYKNEPQVLDGLRFDSKGEARRYLHLKNLQAIGTISGLQVQYPFPLLVNDVHVGDYVADFYYRLVATSEDVIEDFKGNQGTITPVFKLKKKMMAAYGLRVREVYRHTRPAGWDEAWRELLPSKE